MSSWSEVRDRDLEERERIKARCKKPPALVDAKAGNEAWRRYLNYKAKAEGAYAKYMQAPTGGSITARRHHLRYEAYSDVVEEWELAIDEWLRTGSER